MLIKQSLLIPPSLNPWHLLILYLCNFTYLLISYFIYLSLPLLILGIFFFFFTAWQACRIFSDQELNP